MPARKDGLTKNQENINVRDKELRDRIKSFLDANPGVTNLTELVRVAVNEKLDRIESGEDEGIKLKVPKKK